MGATKKERERDRTSVSVAGCRRKFIQNEERKYKSGKNKYRRGSRRSPLPLLSCPSRTGSSSSSLSLFPFFLFISLSWKSIIRTFWQACSNWLRSWETRSSIGIERTAFRLLEYVCAFIEVVGSCATGKRDGHLCEQVGIVTDLQGL